MTSTVGSRAITRPKFCAFRRRYVKPDAETLVRIEADKANSRKPHSRTRSRWPEWSGKFEVPIDTKPSRKVSAPAAPSTDNWPAFTAAWTTTLQPGTPVLAANSGEVVLAATLFYEGNCVIIDHGQQFLTIYMHLSKLSVNEGEKVEKGQEIGLSGATGRATGPHLHVAVRWQGAYLDPAQLWALPLPGICAR